MLHQLPLLIKKKEQIFELFKIDFFFLEKKWNEYKVLSMLLNDV